MTAAGVATPAEFSEAIARGIETMREIWGNGS